MQTDGTLGIVGGGTMGAGIAQAAAQAGAVCVVVEPDDASRARGQQAMTHSWQKLDSKGKLPENIEKLAARVTWTERLDALADCDLIIEAIPEIREAKVELFRQLDSVCATDAILATNTSSIPIAALARSTAHPSRIIGLHFFNPVPLMPLVEVIPSMLTDSSVVTRAEDFVRMRLAKQTIRAKDQAGFVVNAIFVPYLLSAIRAFENGVASAEDIDTGMVGGCGMPMGPLALCDLIGLDTMLLVADSLHAEYRDPATIAPPLLRRHVDAGWLGRKSGRGFYEYNSN